MKNSMRNNPVAAWVAGILMVVGGFALTGCQTSSTENIHFSTVPGEEAMTGGPMAAEGARLAPGDPIRVVFSGITDPPPAHEEQIKEDGTITLPNIPLPIIAQGKTTGVIKAEIMTKLCVVIR